jgi:radical SAM superfamily enzyme YgiQ (UPF0313 family)
MQKIQNQKTLRILLVVPRYSGLESVNYNYTFPLGLGYLSSVMKQAGYDVKVLNLNHQAGTITKILNQWMDKEKYDVIATGHTGMGFSIVKKITDVARRHSSKPHIILGGALITSEKELMFKTLRPDYAVYGEGEVTIIELLKCIQKNGDFKKVEGILFEDNRGNIVITNPRKPIKDINKLPFPDFEGLGFEEYLNNQFTNTFYYYNSYDFPRTLPILASRSCPFQCTFCYHSIGTGYRERSIDNVMEEIELMIKKYDINSIAIYDDLFSARKERILEFCKRISKINENRSHKIRWTCQLSVTNVDDKLLKILKSAGCDVISYGFESFSEEVLKSMHKPITPKQIDSALKATMAAQIGIQANFIFGDPAETVETSKKTLEYWKRECKGQVRLVFVQPYPGSEIYKRCISRGIIKDKIDYIKNDMTKDVIFNMTNSMTDKDIKALSKNIEKLGLKYYKFIIPLSVIKKDGMYKVTIKCPFCNDRTVYGNYFLQNRLIYATYGLVCRSCNMRFNVISPLLYLLKKMSITPMLERMYFKINKLQMKLAR